MLLLEEWQWKEFRCFGLGPVDNMSLTAVDSEKAVTAAVHTEPADQVQLLTRTFGSFRQKEHHTGVVDTE